MNRSSPFPANFGDDEPVRFKGARRTSHLNVTNVGETVVVAFAGGDASDSDSARLSEYKDQFQQLIRQHHCRCIAVDLTGVPRIDSGVLSLLIQIRRRLECVELRNVSATARESLHVTKLDRIFRIQESRA